LKSGQRALYTGPGALARNVRAGAAMSGDARHVLGRSGEDLACAELQRRGYAIVARGYRTRFGEIDAVATDGDTIVFIEVKTRQGDAFGGGAEAVTAWKQRRIAEMAADFLAKGRLHGRPCRFDVVVVEMPDAGREPQIVVYRNAFDAPF
jgi:putative endonuclease